jgi:tRNA (mo5U34)-methyltransferase
MQEDFLHCANNILGKAQSIQLTELTQQALNVNNGNIPKWQSALDILTTLEKGRLSFSHPFVKINTKTLDNSALTQALKRLIPWRKGPYQIGNLTLDSEWRGDMKWDRLKSKISPLKGRSVLDVGAGNGYFTQLMALEGASIALGIEPFLLFNYQFKAIRMLTNPNNKAFVLPLSLEQLPKDTVFDTVFSMGVLYHQKDALQHLQQLKDALKPEGELILETLIIEEKYGVKIMPQNRYAKMRNVWCLPNSNTLKNWLETIGFKNITQIDTTKTTKKEQRATHWIGENSASLKDFLDPNNDNLTIEGLPAPLRSIFIMNK